MALLFRRVKIHHPAQTANVLGELHCCLSVLPVWKKLEFSPPCLSGAILAVPCQSLALIEWTLPILLHCFVQFFPESICEGFFVDLWNVSSTFARGSAHLHIHTSASLLIFTSASLTSARNAGQKSFCFFARVEPPLMQEIHRSACAVFERASCMKCQTTKNTQETHQPKTTQKRQTNNQTEKEAGDS